MKSIPHDRKNTCKVHVEAGARSLWDTEKEQLLDAEDFVQFQDANGHRDKTILSFGEFIKDKDMFFIFIGV